MALAAQSDGLARKSQYAKRLMSEGRFADAIPVYAELVNAVPGNPGLLLNLALAEHMAGQPRQAIPHFEAVLKVQPGSVPALFSLAACHLELNQPRLAVDPLRSVVTADPSNTDARGMLAGALFSLERFGDAAEQYSQLVSLAPRDPKAWFGLGKAYESLATRTFDQLRKTAPQSGYAAALLAESSLQRRQYRSAFFFYRQALEKTPALHGVHAGLAEVYRRAGHPDWAAVEESREKTLSPPACAVHKPECDFAAGRLLAATRSGATPEAMFWRTRAYNLLALQAFRKLGELPPSLELHRVRADLYRGQGQHAEAAAEWREILKLAPADPRAEQELATSLFLAQDYQAAQPVIARLLAADPHSATLNFMAGDSLLRTEQPQRAIPFLETALRFDPKLTAAHASLGLALTRTGRTPQAIPHLETALAIDEDGSLHYQLARAYQAAGQVEKARRMMAQYQDIQRKSQEQKQEAAKQAQLAAP